MELIESILWVVFTLLCIFVSGIILLQEGKGGGLGEAFGGAGQQTFGVKAQGIAKVTGYMAGGLVVIALAIAGIRSSTSVLEIPDAPSDGGAPLGGTPDGTPAGDGGNTDGDGG